MNAFVVLPCPDCSRTIDTFRVSASPSTVTFQATCHPCKTIAEVTLTFDDLRELGEGRSIAATLTATVPEHVM
jgi:invasion protein IalB